MERNRETIGRFVLIECLNGEINNRKKMDNHTYKAYRDNGKKFQKWCRENSFEKKSVFENPKKYIQKYEEDLEKKCLSPSSIHSYLVPVCKAFKVPLEDIKKPKRSAGHIKKSRGYFNDQGQHEATEKRFERLVNFQKAVGIRRSELAALTGSDLQCDENGYLCVHVKKGKGGKEQWQRVLPGYEDVVRKTFYGVEKNQHVFSNNEMNNKIDLHGMRAEVAKEAYSYYEKKLQEDPEYIMQLSDELMERYMAMNPTGKGQEVFFERLNNALVGKPYKLRGENKERAINQKKPLEYNRMALLAVNVFHLSHWREDVGVKNYLL